MKSIWSLHSTVSLLLAKQCTLSLLVVAFDTLPVTLDNKCDHLIHVVSATDVSVIVSWRRSYGTQSFECFLHICR